MRPLEKVTPLVHKRKTLLNAMGKRVPLLRDTRIADPALQPLAAALAHPPLVKVVVQLLKKQTVAFRRCFGAVSFSKAVTRILSVHAYKAVGRSVATDARFELYPK